MSNFTEDLPRRVFWICVALSLLGGAFAYGAFAQSNKLPPLPQLEAVYRTVFGEGDSSVSPRLDRLAATQSHLQPTRGQGNGVTINNTPDDGALIFMTGFFDDENQARLIQRDGTVVRKWPLDYFTHFPDPDARPCDLSSALRTDTHGAHVTPQGEVVFNYEYCGSVKLDQCGGIIWTINKSTHHSLIPAQAGGYWLLARQSWRASDEPDRFPPFSTPAIDQMIREDMVLRVSVDGDVLDEFSIPELMRDNGLEALLTATGSSFDLWRILEPELVHANKVAELSAEFADAFPLFSQGDLAISMRQLNLIMVIDPDTRKVKWHQTGPWIRQHDPEFRPDGRISVFNNNSYRTAYIDGKTDLNAPFNTNITAVDPASRETEILFGMKPGQEMLSVIRGQHEILDDGGMLVTEFDAGRVFQVDAAGRIVWEYVNHYDDEFVGEITNSSIHPKDYFQIEWKACNQ